MNPALQPVAHTAPRASHDMRQLALEALCEENPEEKTALALVLYTKLDTLIIAHEISPVAHTALPGRPVRPALTHPAKVPRRSPLTLEGRAAMVHAICHIEFNAINLALDAAWRFDGMPPWGSTRPQPPRPRGPFNLDARRAASADFRPNSAVPDAQRHKPAARSARGFFNRTGRGRSA